MNIELKWFNPFEKNFLYWSYFLIVYFELAPSTIITNLDHFDFFHITIFGSNAQCKICFQKMWIDVSIFLKVILDSLQSLTGNGFNNPGQSTWWSNFLISLFIIKIIKYFLQQVLFFPIVLGLSHTKNQNPTKSLA